MLQWNGILQWTVELRQLENTQFVGTGTKHEVQRKDKSESWIDVWNT
jgi:hypothetical protein